MLPTQLREMGEALRAEIEAILLDQPEGIFLEAMKDAEAAINRFLEQGVSDDGVAALADLRAALAIGGEAVPAGAAQDTQEILDECATFVERLRAMSVERIGAASFAPELPARHTASVGSPQVYSAGEVDPPEVLSKPEPWGEAPNVAELLDATERAQPKAGPKLPVPREVEMIADLGRDALEDIAIMGSLRLLREEEPWRDVRGFEERLLANLDALWSLDRPRRKGAPLLRVPRAAFRYASEWSAPDWGRSFAFAFALACSDSEVALRWVLLALMRADPKVMDAYVHALALGSNPHLQTALLSFLHSEASPEALVVVLGALRRRRTFSAGDMLPLLAHPDARVALAVVRCISNAPRESALAALSELSGAKSPEVRLLALEESAMLGGNADALRLLLRDFLAERGSEVEARTALRVLALLGDERDQEAVLAAALKLEDGLPWLGWYGRSLHLGVLARELEQARGRGPDGVGRAQDAERAITRISGLPAAEPVSDLEPRMAAFRERVPARRVRRGQEHDATLVLAELADPATRHCDRRVLAAELSLFGRAPRLDVDGWFAIQAAELALLKV